MNSHKAKDKKEYLIMRRTNYVTIYDKNVWIVSGATVSTLTMKSLNGVLIAASLYL